MSYLKWTVFINWWTTNRKSYKIDFSLDFSRVKNRCQLIARLKANKYYQKFFCYLSFYINLLNIRLCGWLQAPSRFQTFSFWFRTSIKIISNTGTDYTCSYIWPNVFWLTLSDRSWMILFFAWLVLDWYCFCSINKSMGSL